MSRIVLSGRISISLLIILLLPVLQLQAKDKKKQLFPEDVLQARTVMVVIHPDAGETLATPLANRNAQDEVERALTKWGRFDLVMDAYTADLIIAVRKGNKERPHYCSFACRQPAGHLPARHRRRAHRPANRSPPDLSQPLPGDMGNRGPQLGAQVFSSDDTFEVYRGGFEYPLDTSPVWRFIAKDSLNAPKDQAVEQFRKAIEESEKQRQHKP